MINGLKTLMAATPASAAFGVLLVGSTVFSCRAEEATPLDRYVAASDPAYHYALLSTIPGDGYRGYVLELTSQQWRKESEVDRPLWKHWLIIVVPDQVKTTVGMLMIAGGTNASKPPAHISPVEGFIAKTTGSVVSELRMVPNEPLTFAGETRRRSEDAITAYSWDKYLRTGDETWPLQLPMTKSVVRAMDAVTTFCRTAQGGGVAVDRFAVGGASKRGWTAWLTAAVDKRVVAVAPVVIDALNIEASFDHHYRAYGFWAPTLRDYEEMGIMNWIGTAPLEALLRIVDPYSYRDRLTMPKYIVNAAGDQYFLPDSSQFYFDGLPGEKYLRYLPNTDHSLKEQQTDAATAALAFYQSIIDGTPRPEFTWRFEEDGAIRVATKTPPSDVRLWQAANATARDFRLQTIGPAFTSSVLKDEGDGVYVGRVPAKAQGWVAYFVELDFPNASGNRFNFTTSIHVAPDRLPYSPPPQRASPNAR
jgi:PhoPQ-activated pathogenicity-related protein